MKIIANKDYLARAEGSKSLKISNDVDPRQLAKEGALEGTSQIELNFPKFTDGRAYSQAYLLRRRLGFKGKICATGDVLVDQLQQMQRSGFDVAVLRDDQSLDIAHQQLERFGTFYQGDAVVHEPHFQKAA